MFYLIDKPLGISSFDVIRKLRQILKVKKMGHLGTLDPLATGCLLMATENSTKLLPLIEGGDKTYVFTVNISGSTPSLDLGTDITRFDLESYHTKSPGELEDFISSQTTQIPPQYSALHIDGKRAYELARDGIDFVVESRTISVRDVRILFFAPPVFTISLRISSGGYIRSFAPIIGQFFGTPGGYITELRRTTIHTPGADLTAEIAHSLEDLSEDDSLSRNILFPNIENTEIDDTIRKELEEGRIIQKIAGIHPNIGELYFLDHREGWSSLVEYKQDGFNIIRNNI